jgi:hypothetical protein
MTLFRTTLIQCLLLSALALVGISHAQPEQDSWLNTSISGLALDGQINDLKILSNGETLDIDLYTTTRSRRLKYRGPKQLTFFRESEPLTPEGEPIRTPVGGVTLDGLHPRYLLLFAKRSGDTENYSIFAIPDTTEHFKAGTYRFLNLAPFKVAIKIGESKHILAEKNITDVTGDFEHGNYYQTMMLSLPEGEAEPVPAYSGRIYFNKHMRMLYIIRPKEGGKAGKIKFTGIPERVASK